MIKDSSLLGGLMIGLILGFGVGWIAVNPPQLWPEKLPPAKETIIQPLQKYKIENLGKRNYESHIILDEVTASNAAFFVQKFHFDSDGKNVTGLAHIPTGCDKCPVIVQIRGYAEPETYQSGYGTWRSAERFVQAGFISLAPDFLGYGGSASPSADVFEARFETYTTVLNLLAAVQNWNYGNGKIGIWGHSNGGQIAMTVSEVSGKDYPTVLWAPVSAGFPYSILYYMNDNSEGDKELRRKLFDFENEYNAGQFNLLNYLDRINASIQLHQGTGDKSVPVEWNRDLVNILKKSGKDIRYFEYPGADHNLTPDWETVIQRDIDFFKENFK